MSQGRKLVYMLFSLLAAVSLWLYVVTTVAPEANTHISGIPINIDGGIVLEQRGLIITDQDISEIAVDLTATRVSLSKLNPTTIRISADASKIREPGTFALDCSVTFPDTIRASDVDLLRKSSDTVNITVAKLEKKAIPIRLDWSGSVKEGYLFEAESAEILPEVVTITGPDYEVVQVSEAVVRYDVSDLDQTEIASAQIVFLGENGEALELSSFTTVDVTEASLTLPVYRTKEIAIAVDLKYGGGITEDNAEVTLSTDTIRVKGAADVIEAMEDVFTVGSIDLSAIVGQEDFSFNLTLPAGVICASGETQIEVSVNIVGLLTDTIQVYDIRLENVPEGYEAELTTRTAQVTVRGSSSDIVSLKRNKTNGIYVLVDLQNYSQTGAFTVSGRVVNDTQPRIGVVENVEVGVVISVPSETESESQE